MKNIDKKLEQTDPRSRRTWRFTTADIVAATGYSARRVRNDIYLGVVDPRCLISLGQYVMVAVLSSRALSDGRDWTPFPKPAKTESTYDYGDSQERSAVLSVFDRPATPPPPDVPF